MTTRYEAIKAAQAAAQKARLARAAEDLRAVAEDMGVTISFFGSFAEDRVDSRSDLDVAIPDDIAAPLRRRLEDAMERRAAAQGVSIDIVSRASADDLGASFVP